MTVNYCKRCRDQCDIVWTDDTVGPIAFSTDPVVRHVWAEVSACCHDDFVGGPLDPEDMVWEDVE